MPTILNHVNHSQKFMIQLGVVGTNQVKSWAMGKQVWVTRKLTRGWPCAPLRLKSSRPREYWHNSLQLSMAASLLTTRYSNWIGYYIGQIHFSAEAQLRVKGIISLLILYSLHLYHLQLETLQHDSFDYMLCWCSTILAPPLTLRVECLVDVVGCWEMQYASWVCGIGVIMRESRAHMVGTQRQLLCGISISSVGFTRIRDLSKAGVVEA